jgi:hypothetical protein
MYVAFDYLPNSGTITVSDTWGYGGSYSLITAAYQLSYNTTGYSTSTAVNHKFTDGLNTSIATGSGGNIIYSVYVKRGIFRTTTAGTLTPQLVLSSTSGLTQAPNIQQGSYIKVTPVGSSSTNSIGAWA